MSASNSFDDAQLAAYLAGDVDDVTARRIEAVLATDLELGRRLDRVHDAMVAVRTPDKVEPPPELAARIVDAVAVERSPAERTVSVPERHRWLRLAVPVAAAVAALALVGVGWLGLPGTDDAADEGIVTMQEAEAPADQDAPVPEAETDDAEDLPEAAPLERQQDTLIDPAPEPDDGMTGPISLEDAAEAADRHWGELERGPAACRADVDAALPGPAVPLDVVETRHDGRPAFAFRLVTAPEDGEFLDRPAFVVVDADSCEVLETDVSR